MKNDNTLPELSRPLQVDKISLGGVVEDIVASAIERQALAKRFGLLELGKLDAHVNVDHAEGKMLAVTGSFQADVVQECVVTLEPVACHIHETIDVLFAPAHLIDREGDGPMADVGAADFPEPIENGIIDLGELVAQHLATALDPYPRKPGVTFDGFETTLADKGASNPFVKLKVIAKNEDKTSG